MQKLTSLRATLKKSNLDAILITNPVNRMYITGFTGTAGVVLISRDEAYLITDFRYIEQASEQTNHVTIIEHKQAIESEINKLLKQLKITKLGFEKRDVTYDLYERYNDFFDVELVPVAGVVEEIRLIKSAEELQVMKQAAAIADKAYNHIQSYIKPGVKEIDIANELEFFMRSLGATSSSFDIIVASGYRSALPHGVASEKKIEQGELVTLDYGALYKGYCSDITRTLAVGEISEELEAIYTTVLGAQEEGVKRIGPGMTGQEADAITRDFIAEKGYGKYFGHSTGHGLGLEVHEEPRLSTNSQTVLEPGMVVTVEPGIYVPKIGGCRIEDDIVITKSGNERLTHATKKLIYL